MLYEVITPLEYLGDIPQDANVSKAVINQKPVTLLYPNSSASYNFV